MVHNRKKRTFAIQQFNFRKRKLTVKSLNACLASRLKVKTRADLDNFNGNTHPKP